MSPRREPVVLVFREAYEDESNDELVVIPGYAGRFRRLHESKQDGLRTPRAREYNAVAEERQRQKFTKFALKVPRVKGSDTQPVAKGARGRAEGGEQTGPEGHADAHVEGGELEQDAVVSEEQTEPEGHASADLGIEEVEHGEVSSGDTASSALRACLGLATGAVSVVFGYRLMLIALIAALVAVLITKACNSAQDHHKDSIVSPKASDCSQNQSAIPNQCSQDQADKALPSVESNDQSKLLAKMRGFLLALFAELDDSFQEQNHSSSSKAGNSPQDQSATAHQGPQNQADSARSSIKLNDSLQEQNHSSSPQASDASQNQSATTDQCSQDQDDTARSSVGMKDSFQEQDHSPSPKVSDSLQNQSAAADHCSQDQANGAHPGVESTDSSQEKPHSTNLKASHASHDRSATAEQCKDQADSACSSAELNEASDSPQDQNATAEQSSQGQADSARSSVELDDSLTEQNHSSVASSNGSNWSLDLVDDTETVSPQDSGYGSGESRSSSQKRSSSSSSSSRTSIWSPVDTDRKSEADITTQAHKYLSRSGSTISDSALDSYPSSDAESTVKDYHSISDSDSGLVGDETATASADEGASKDHLQDAFTENDCSRDSWEGETPPLNINYDALRHIASTCLSHGRCVDITTLHRGSFHEVRVLHFEDGWSCIGRFTRDYEMLRKTESELATIEYVRKNTSIPVPRIYFVNHNENHVVGAAFVLMELLQGQRLCNIWTGLTLEHKKSVVGQLANVLGQLAELKFDAIGSLDADGNLGPLLNITEPTDAMSDKAFQSSMDYFLAFLNEDHPARTSAARKYYPAIQDELRSFFSENTENPTLNAPYRLIHNDFDSQNILVVHEDKALPPKISGVIDWDWSYIGPLYYLCEYPHDLCDWSEAPEDFADNKVLRKHLVATLIEYFPEDSQERKEIKQCFREKSYILNCFQSVFMSRVWDEELGLTEQYLMKMRGECSDWERLPYDGTFDWERDSDLTDSDAEDPESQSDDDDDDDHDDDDHDDGGSEVHSDDGSENLSIESVEEAE